MMWPFSRKPKKPVETIRMADALTINYRSTDGVPVSVAIISDPKIAGTFVVACNGIPIGRVWVEDNGISLGVSDTVGPIKLVS